MSVSKSKQTLSSRYVSGPTQTRKTGSKIMIIICTLVLIALVVGIILIFVFGDEEKDFTSSDYNLVVTPDDIEEQLANVNINKVAPGSYDVCMNSTWTFKDAKSVSENAYVENLITNNNTVHFSVTRNDTEDVIYESPYIPVGSKLMNIKLSDETLTEGTYDCTVTYHLVDEDNKEISSLNIAVSIIIQN